MHLTKYSLGIFLLFLITKTVFIQVRTCMRNLFFYKNCLCVYQAIETSRLGEYPIYYKRL